MKYLVMECHRGYAVVLDPQGRFLRVANQNFEVGQRVETVVQMAQTQPSGSKVLWRNLAAVAACLCLLLVGTWQGLLAPYGSVRIKINPDVKITVNRLDRVIRVEPLNPDAQALLVGYDPQMQKIDRVADQLADRAKEMGFLKEGKQIQVTVESTHSSWKTATQDRLILELKQHISDWAEVIPNTEPIPDHFREEDDDDDWDDDEDDDDDPEDDDEDIDDPEDDDDDINDPEDDDDDIDDSEDDDDDGDDPEDDDDDIDDPEDDDEDIDDPEDGDDDIDDPEDDDDDIDDPEDDDEDGDDPEDDDEDGDDPEDDDEDIDDPEDDDKDGDD